VITFEYSLNSKSVAVGLEALFPLVWVYLMFEHISEKYHSPFLKSSCVSNITVGTATGYGLDGLRAGVYVPVEMRFSRPGLGLTQPPIQWVQRALSPGVKWPESETDHSPPSSVVVKTVDLYIHFPIRLHGAVFN
jgi:hypothetical protein